MSSSNSSASPSASPSAGDSSSAGGRAASGMAAVVPIADGGAAAAGKPSLMLRRHIKASPAKVYEAWTRPDQLERWFGPAGATAASAALDVRVGGRFFIRFATPDGEEHGVGGVYQEIVPPERLVFDWAWQSTPERVSLVTLRFAPDGEGTLFTLVHEQFFDEAARAGHERGWTGCLDRLVAAFATAT